MHNAIRGVHLKCLAREIVWIILELEILQKTIAHTKKTKWHFHTWLSWPKLLNIAQCSCTQPDHCFYFLCYNCRGINQCLHSSVGVDSIPAFSHILDLGWIDMLHLLHLLRDNRKEEIKDGKQEYLKIFLSFLYKKSQTATAKAMVRNSSNYINAPYKKRIFLCGCRHVHTCTKRTWSAVKNSVHPFVMALIFIQSRNPREMI